MFVNKLNSETLQFNSSTDNKLDELESSILSIYNTINTLIDSSSSGNVQKYVKTQRSGLVVPLHLLEVLESTDKIDEYLETLNSKYSENVESKIRRKELLKASKNKFKYLLKAPFQYLLLKYSPVFPLYSKLFFYCCLNQNLLLRI